MVKKLNVAFVWHFHQPFYQENNDSDFLMPWTRLHATKDYLDMLHKIDNHKNLKLNFNLSPTLIDSLEKYGNGKHDIHSRLLITPVEDLDNKDKAFILNNFFDANYNNLILPRAYFTELYNKKMSSENITVNDFSNQEYSDIMANFTLAWMDQYFLEVYPELGELSKKEKGYTLHDRLKIYEFTRKIITSIIPEFKKYQDSGKIEISANPYYHPIIPLLINKDELFCPYIGNMPKQSENLRDDAKIQTKMALDRYEKLFGKRPKGVWLSEQCISQKTIEMLEELGVEWTLADIGILSNTIGREFARDFNGNLDNPFDMCCSAYLTEGKNHKTKIIFADSFLSNLVAYGYGNYDSEAGAIDLYEKIKTVQDKLQNSPEKEHLLTIAMDGENCWEYYKNDGADFLNKLYSLICEDTSLKTVLMSNFLKQNKKTIKIKEIASGSWINRNFNLWIGEPVKNIAWKYLTKARDDIEEFLSEIDDEELKKKALQEIYIAEGSDWFWWYGEPNDSGKDHIFDHLFRTHLKNAYQILNKPYPMELDTPLISVAGKPIRHPKQHITPNIDGCSEHDSEEDMANAGFIFTPDSPTFVGNKLIRSIHFCNDSENIYLRFEFNKKTLKEHQDALNQLYIYFQNQNEEYYSPIRLINKTDRVAPIINNPFSKEVKLTFNADKIHSLNFSQAIMNGLWTLKPMKKIQCAFKDVLELGISFKELGIQVGESVDFCIILGRNGIIDDIIPQDILLRLTNN